MNITLRRAASACTAILIACNGSAFAQELSLDDALRRTHERNPRLAAMREAHLATEGRRIAAAARPNPELSFEAENVRFGDGPDTDSTLRTPDDTVLEQSRESASNSGFGESELTLMISQAIELGGKRARRIALADAETQAALWDYEVARGTALAQTRQAFVDALAAQELTALRGRLAALAAEGAQAAAIRVDAGKDSPMLRDRADVEHAQARIALAAAERQRVATRYVLAAQWDDREPDFDAVGGDLYAIAAPPDAAALREALERSPDLARWTSEVTVREAAVALARSNRSPDLTLSLGWRGMTLPETTERTFDAGGALTTVSRSEPDDDWDHSIVFGVSVPLPLFNRNRGAVLEAEHLAARAGHERRAGIAEAWADLLAVLVQVEAAHAAAVELRDAVIPAAQRAFDAAELGFQSGKFTYLESLDAQRTLFEVQSDYIVALAEYHRGVAELERLLGARTLDAAAEGANP
jgi:cobalt-zinc-cadmium efflux system outer membrane protein